MTGSRQETVFAREGEKAGMETDQIAIVLGDGTRLSAKAVVSNADIKRTYLELVYAQMATVSKTAVFSYDATGRLTFVGAVANRGSKLPCWSLVSKDGRRLYTSNAGNGTVTVFEAA